jgi:hypothetical protein
MRSYGFAIAIDLEAAGMRHAHTALFAYTPHGKPAG